MNVEELEQQIIDMKSQIDSLTNERNELTSNLDKLKNDNDNLRELNQKLFIRATSHEPQKEEKKYKSIQEISDEMRGKKE